MNRQVARESEIQSDTEPYDWAGLQEKKSKSVQESRRRMIIIMAIRNLIHQKQTGPHLFYVSVSLSHLIIFLLSLFINWLAGNIVYGQSRSRKDISSGKENGPPLRSPGKQKSITYCWVGFLKCQVHSLHAPCPPQFSHTQHSPAIGQPRGVGLSLICSK